MPPKPRKPAAGAVSKQRNASRAMLASQRRRIQERAQRVARMAQDPRVLASILYAVINNPNLLQLMGNLPMVPHYYKKR